MGETSKVIMGAMLIMVVILALVLALVLVLLAELYCSLLLRRKQLRTTNFITTTSPAATPNTTNTTTTEPWQQEDQSGGSSLSSFYAQGVLQAPRSFLFPAVSNRDNMELEKQHSKPSQFIGSQTHHVRLLFSSPPSPTPFTPLDSPKLVQEVPLHCSTSTFNEKQIMYICNPIYDNEANGAIRVDTPFETPDSSPSRLDTVGSSEEDDDICQETQCSPSSPPLTPRLTPMEKLPAEACSVSLGDGRSLGTSGSDSNSNNDGISLSSSASPCTSPSW